MSDINIVLEQRDDIHVAVEEKDINVEVPAGKDGRSLRPRGEWSASATYAYLDLVSYEGSSYVALKAVPAGTLPTDTSYWMLLAEKGEPGGSVWGLIAGDLSDQTDLQEALDAKAPVILSSASGSIASFTDGSASPVTALSVSIEPVQDLHGYDNPWPAGGGSNIWDEETELGRLDLTTGVNYPSPSQIRTKNYVPVDPSKTYYFVTKEGSSNNVWMMFYDSNKDVVTEDLPSGAGSSTNARNIRNGTVLSLPNTIAYVRWYYQISYGTTYNHDTSLNYPSSVTTYSPYSNICPISGWDEATVTRTGKNLLPKTNASATTRNGITFTPQEDGSIKVYGTATAQADFTLHTVNSLSIAKNGIYTYSCQGVSANVRLVVGGGSNTSGLNYTELGLSQYGNTKTQTLKKGTLGHCFIRVTNSATVNTTLYPQFELSSSATAFEPYQGTSITIDLDGTRYGGTLNVLTGTMTVTKAIVDLGDMSWSYITSYTRFESGYLEDVIKRPSANTVPAEMICSLYANVPATDVTANNATVGVIAATGHIILHDDRFTQVSDLKTAITGQKLVYALATPLTVPLTPSQMQTLLGENHIWADTGDVSVEYRADTKLYIDGKVAQTAKVTRQMIANIATADGKAPKSLATGDLIIVGDELRKATANIGNGSAITASNSTTATLADVIKALQ